jgi:polysaccharide biosynthesis protein PelD
MSTGSGPKRRVSANTVKWLETAGMTLAVLGVGYFVNGSDPFMITERFPWIWFAPVLAALRYGLASGIGSVSIIVCFMSFAARSGRLPYPFPLEHLLGGLLLVMICGQFGSFWQKRLKRSDQLSQHALERAQQVSRAYFMVRLSHDRLEQNLISKPVTLRQAMVDMQLLLVRHEGEITGEVAAELLSILANYCNLDSAAIYPVVAGRLAREPVASYGKGAPCDQDDVLLRSAMESDTTTYQSIEMLQPGRRSSYLVASPLCSSSGELLAMLLVTEMPFLSLQRETLQIMGVLLSYFVEHAFAAAKSADMLAVYPDCPPVFACELIKMHRLSKDLGIESILGMIHVHPNPRDEEIALSIEKKQRGLDHVWRITTPAGILLITLMPFSGITGGEGYLGRIKGFLGDRFGIEHGDGLITTRLLQVVATVSPLGHLSKLLELEGIDGESSLPVVRSPL